MDGLNFGATLSLDWLGDWIDRLLIDPRPEAQNMRAACTEISRYTRLEVLGDLLDSLKNG